MDLRRGMIITVALHEDLGKPRPAIVIQAEEYLEDSHTILLMPLSSFQADSPFIRPTIQPSSENGLSSVSQIMADKITPARRSSIGAVIGQLSDEDMARAECALINITGLRRTILPIQIDKPEGMAE